MHNMCVPFLVRLNMHVLKVFMRIYMMMMKKCTPDKILTTPIVVGSLFITTLLKSTVDLRIQ